MNTKLLLTVSLCLSLAGSAWADPPKDELQDADSEKVERLEFQIPEKVIAEPSSTDPQAMNKKEMAEKLAKKADVSTDESTTNELTHVVQQGSETRDAASGMATGKRQHKPVSNTKGIDKATPGMVTSVPEGTGAMNKCEVISEIATEHLGGSTSHEDDWKEPKAAEPEMALTFDEALAACRDKADLQACVDMKTGQSSIRQLDKSSTK